MNADVDREREATYFAMHLLVPTVMLRAELNKLGGLDVVDDDDKTLRELARKFKVSKTIIAFRIAEEATKSR